MELDLRLLVMLLSLIFLMPFITPGPYGPGDAMNLNYKIEGKNVSYGYGGNLRFTKVLNSRIDWPDIVIKVNETKPEVKEKYIDPKILRYFNNQTLVEEVISKEELGSDYSALEIVNNITIPIEIKIRYNNKDYIIEKNHSVLISDLTSQDFTCKGIAYNSDI